MNDDKDAGCIEPTMPNSPAPTNQGMDSVYIGRSPPPHDKVYANGWLGGKRPWICRKCGKEGKDPLKVKLTTYEELKLKFKDKS